MTTPKNRLLLLLFPLLFVGWGIFAVVAFDPFYSRSADPEFPYLINGLTVALLQSDDIGHIDHPGTPFQVIIGIGLRIIHFLSGNDSITYDVLSRHQHYLAGISLMLTVLTSLVLLGIGITGRRRGIPVWNLVILQAGFLFSDLIMWHYVRMVPERWMLLTSLLFIWAYLAYGYDNRHMIKFAIWSGIIMGMGLATKFNYLPLLILPLFIIHINKLRLVYAGTAIASFFVSILPVIDKFADYRRFITNIAQHDGLYGSGEARIFNVEKIAQGLQEILSYTPELLLWLALIIFAIVWTLLHKNLRHTRQATSLFIAFLVALILQTLMVAKHFKAAYQIPFHSILGFIMFSFSLYVARINIPKRLQFVSIAAACLLLSGINIWRMVGDVEHIFAQQRQRDEISRFVSENMPAQAVWFVEPAWLSGPHQENAIIFGLSYARNRHKYLPELKRINPNVITYEGNTDAVKIWRGEPASLDSLVATGSAIHVYDTPARNAWVLINMLQQSAEKQGLILQTDTIFAQPETNSHIVANKALN